MKSKSPYRLTKSYREGIFCFVVLCILLQIAIYFIPQWHQDSLEVTVLPASIQNVNVENKAMVDNGKIKQFEAFDPNSYTQAQWQLLGLSEAQVKTVLNYKKAIGGFTSKEQFQKCYAISEELYAEIEPFILLPDQYSKKSDSYKKTQYQEKNFTPKTITYTRFDPNTYTQKDWEKIGFSAKQAQSILNYKNGYLGGAFSNLEEVSKSFVISNEKYEEMKPYMFLSKPKPKSEEKEDQSTRSERKEIKPFNCNALEREGWKALGFSDKQVTTILKYKALCGGRFSSLDQFKKCYVVSDQKFEELKPYIRFE